MKKIHQEYKGKRSQKDLLSKQINKKEYKDLNGKKIEDVLWIGDVAALITASLKYEALG